MTLVKVITVVAALAVCVQCICALNHMTLRTRNSVRVAYLGLLLSAAAAALSPCYGIQPSLGDAVLIMSVSAFVFVNRRRAYMVGPT